MKDLREPDQYYLAGGTANHLGHRRSRDLDIFRTAPIAAGRASAE